MIDLQDLLYVFLASLTSSLVAEGISWFFIYRTATHKKLKSTIEKLTKKLEKKKRNRKQYLQSKKLFKKN